MINRRKALGALTGGVVAAPELAKAAMDTQGLQQVWNAPTINYGAADKVETNLKISSHADYVRDQIARAKKILAGEWDEHQLYELEICNNLENVQIENIHGLKSISMPNKRLMVIETQRKNMKDKWIKDAKRSLALYAEGFLT